MADTQSIGDGGLPLHNPTESANGVLALTWSGNELTRIEKTVGLITYRKTLTWSSGQLTAISAWVEI